LAVLANRSLHSKKRKYPREILIGDRIELSEVMVRRPELDHRDRYLTVLGEEQVIVKKHSFVPSYSMIFIYRTEMVYIITEEVGYLRMGKPKFLKRTIDGKKTKLTKEDKETIIKITKFKEVL